MSITNRSVFLGTQFDHGIDFAEFSGSWPMPEACNGAIKIFDDNNQMRILVLDYSDGCFYDISLRDGPSDNYITEGFLDKINTDGTGGQNISPVVTFKEDTGEYEKFISEHHSSRFYLRPNKETNRNQTGYDSKGFVSDIEFKSEIYVDGEPTTLSASSDDITRNNEVVYDVKVEGHRLQTKFSANRSDFKLVGRQQEYITKDIQYDPENRTTTEQSRQSAWSTNSTHWFTRGEISPTTCRITGEIIAGNISLSTGMDDNSNTSISATNGNSIVFPALNLTTSSRVYFWSNRLLTSDVITLNSGIVTPTLVYSSTWFLYYFDLSSANSNYTFTITVSGTELKLFDVRIFNTTTTFTTSQILYYINDINVNNGNNLLPLV